MASDIIMASQTAAMEGLPHYHTHYVCRPEGLIHRFLQYIQKSK